MVLSSYFNPGHPLHPYFNVPELFPRKEAALSLSMTTSPQKVSAMENVTQGPAENCSLVPALVRIANATPRLRV